jgi:four helix bundle protein
VYKLCDEVRQRVRRIVARPEFRAHPRLRDQLSEAAESPCPNIGEGFSRYYPRENARFVGIAKSSLTEVIEHLGRAKYEKLIETEEHDETCSVSRRARGAAVAYIRYLVSAEAPSLPRKRRKPRR